MYPMKNGQWIFFAVLVSLVSCRKSSHSSRDLADPTVYADTVFSQEYHEAYALNNGSDNNVRSIAIDHDDNVWIATQNGVFRKNKRERVWFPMLPKEEQGPSFDVEADQQSVWISTWNAVFQFRDGNLYKIPGAKSPISSLCISAEGVYALGPTGTWLFSGEKWEQKNFKIARSIRDA